MTTLPVLAAVTMVTLVAGTLVVGAVALTRRGDDESPWAPGELASLADGDTAPRPAVGLHRGYGTFAYEELGADQEYQPRHGLDPDEGAEIPPSMVPALELMTPLERARELVRQLHQARWHPWVKLPRLERIRYVAATVAARNGVPLLLGQLAPVGRLP